MNRQEFMRQLENLLRDIPESDRQDAISYYNGYFDEAGEENEAEVIQELGSPGKVAGIIKSDLNSQEETAGEFTENGYQDSYSERERQVPSKREQGYQEPHQKNRIPMVLIILLAIATVPVWGSLAAGLLGVVLGILGAALGIVLGLGGVAAGGIIAGVGCVIGGIVYIFQSPAIGILLTGIGFLIIAVGIACLIAFLWLILKVIPLAFRTFVDLCNRVLRRGQTDRSTSEQDKGEEEKNL